MLEALIALAALAGNTVVAAATTDAWEAARRKFARLLGRGDPDKTKAAERRLEDTRDQLTKAAGAAARSVSLRPVQPQAPPKCAPTVASVVILAASRPSALCSPWRRPRLGSGLSQPEPETHSGQTRDQARSNTPTFLSHTRAGQRHRRVGDSASKYAGANPHGGIACARSAL